MIHLFRFRQSPYYTTIYIKKEEAGGRGQKLEGGSCDNPTSRSKNIITLKVMLMAR